MNETALKKLAKPLILLTTLIWGTSFVVMKNTLDNIPTFYLLAVRFLFAAAMLSVIFFKRWKGVDKGYLSTGGMMGLLLFSAYTAQTRGLAGTTPGKNAFLTAAYCVIVPFLSWIAVKKQPDRYNIIAAVLCIGGIGLVSVDAALTMTRGDALTLLGGFFFAAHMVAVAKFAQGRDIFLLTIVQFAAAGAAALLCAMVFESVPAALPSSTLTGLIYLTVAATAGGLLFQNIGQKYTEPSAASVLLSLEAPFGVVASMLFYGERPTARMLLGFVLIFAAVLCSETKFDFFKKRVDNFKTARL
ncbi:MAG: DMT family transporter [Clostridia bacterium]|nr:DMT family transporter [Clostridia bacterium]